MKAAFKALCFFGLLAQILIRAPHERQRARITASSPGPSVGPVGSARPRSCPSSRCGCRAKSG